MKIKSFDESQLEVDVYSAPQGCFSLSKSDSEVAYFEDIDFPIFIGICEGYCDSDYELETAMYVNFGDDYWIPGTICSAVHYGESMGGVLASHIWYTMSEDYTNENVKAAKEWLFDLLETHQVKITKKARKEIEDITPEFLKAAEEAAIKRQERRNQNKNNKS